MTRPTPYLMRAAIVFAVCLLLASIMAGVSYFYMDAAYQEHAQARRAMQRWKTKLDRSVESNQIIDEFESNFLKLVNRGVVGEEDRISWFETVQNTARKRGMPLVKYSISEQMKLEEKNLAKEFRGIDVFKSTMTLDVKMAHEGDLFALLNDLRSADGLYAVDNCEIERLKLDAENAVDNMAAYCELGWYTFRGSGQSASQGRKR